MNSSAQWELPNDSWPQEDIWTSRLEVVAQAATGLRSTIYSSSSYELAYTITKVTTISCYCFTFILGIIGNGLVIRIAGCEMKTISAVWFLNLAIADSIHCISLPIRIMGWLILSQHEFYVGIIYVNLTMFHLSSVSSVTFLMVISIDRCVTIMWPLWSKVHRTRRFARNSSVVLWLLCLVIVMSQILYFPNEIHIFYWFAPSFKDLEEWYGEPFYDTFTRNTMLARCIVMFAVPFAIILVCYGLIICKLHTDKIRRPMAFQRTFKIIVAAVGGFFGCWFPYNVWPFIARWTSARLIFIDLTVSCLCICLVAVSSCLNPILYALLGQKQRPGSRQSIKARMENVLHDFK